MISKIKSTLFKTISILSDGSLSLNYRNCNLKTKTFSYTIKDFKKYQVISKTKLLSDVGQVDDIKKFRKLFLNK